jgi:hypothetical protein
MKSHNSDAQSRENRVAAALRDNLRKRKQQQNARQPAQENVKE